MHEGKRARYSLDTFNWEEASRKLLEITADKTTVDASVVDAVKDFIADCERRKLKSTRKYSEVLNPLLQFCFGRAVTTVRALDLPTLRKFVGTLEDSSLTVGKKIERLRTFIRHCNEMGWIENNPATKIKKPKVTNPPVVPFTSEQHQAIIGAVEKYPVKNSFGYDNRKRVLAFLLTLRYTALRMSDVVQLKRTAVKNGRVLLRTTKTGAPIYLPLPPTLLTALKAIENGVPYYFWSGEGKLKSVISTWQRAFNTLLTLAEVEGHPHMYRHMMAIELLEKGTLVEHVAAILGNSPGIVYKHYAPWIASRQKALDDAIRATWDSTSPS
jgi:integrase